MAKTINIDIEGMHCAACSSRIERVVSNLEGINSCTVNLATHRGQIELDSAKIAVNEILESIGGLGFTAELKKEGEASEKNVLENSRAQLVQMQKRLIPCFFFALIIMVLSMGPMVGLTLPDFISPETSPLTYAFTQFILILPVLYLGRSFYTSGIPALLRRLPNMDSLIALGTGAAVVYSTWNLIEIGLGVNVHDRAHDLYYEAAAMLIALVSLGKYLEERSKSRTTEAIQQLMQLAPENAILVGSDGSQQEIPVKEIREENRILVKPGERIPVDGVVVEGDSKVDESMLTGESWPANKDVGDNLFGGTLNKNGALVMSAKKVGEDTVLARIIKLVENAQATKPPIANLADRISLYFVPIVMMIALIAGCTWFFLGAEGFSFSLRIFIAVLVIACPCAMGLATPTSIMVATGRGAQLGVLIKAGDVLQKAEKISCVVFDKTGTLTVGSPQVTDFHVYGSSTEKELLQLVAAAEKRSEHPLAEAILERAENDGIHVPEPEVFTAVQGKGVKARVVADGKTSEVHIGNLEFVLENKVSGLSENVKKEASKLLDQGKTLLYVSIEGSLAGLIGITDPLKEEARQEIEVLKKQGLELVMLTGDNEKTAQAVAQQAGMSRVVAGVLPENKEKEVVRLQKKGHIVAMVGDGINDAPALARADVGIAMGTGIDVAIESADIVLMSGDLNGVQKAIGLSRATMKNIKQNLFWAFAYNVIGIPVAAGLLAVFGGPTLNPMIGGAAMAMSSVSVVSNALRLRWYK